MQDENFSSAPGVVITLGHTIDTPHMLKQAISEGGVTMVRANLAHGGHKLHREKLLMLHEYEKERGERMTTFADLSGPKVYVEELNSEDVELFYGDEVTFAHSSHSTTSFPVSYEDFADFLQRGDLIICDNGKITCEVTKVEGKVVFARVLVPGILSSGATISAPGVVFQTPPLTAKDRKDIDFALRAGYDMIALSGVRSAAHINELREVLKEKNASLPVIAKIETLEALKDLEEIVSVADMIMVMRSDLAVNVGSRHVPLIEKDILRYANRQNKKVIIVTALLSQEGESGHSQLEEVTDALKGGAQFLMLSDRGGVSLHPVHSARMLRQLISEYDLKKGVRPQAQPEK